jgi:hypothetical protein
VRDLVDYGDRKFGTCEFCAQTVITHHVQGVWLTGWYIPPAIQEEPL